MLNSSLINIEPTRGDIEVVRLAASTIAEEIGNARSANMIMLGALIKKSNLVKLDTLFEVLKDTFGKKEKLIAVNKEALLAGYNRLYSK